MWFFRVEQSTEPLKEIVVSLEPLKEIVVSTRKIEELFFKK